MSSICVVGSLAFDSIETPFGKAPKILGGSANYFSLSASYFTSVQCVSVVGEDFPPEHIKLLESKGINTEGIKVAPGKTFHWAGQYGYDLHEATTLQTHLNVFEHFKPEVPEKFRNSEVLFLGNIAPALQTEVVKQMNKPKFTAIDTMNFWIESSRDKLIEAISHANCLIINEAEVRQLTKMHNVVQAAKVVASWGPQILVVKRGEYGALLFDHGDIFSLPGLPLSEVKDPTGAGDTFAGGFVGYLASQRDLNVSSQTLRRAVVYGCVMASFTVQEFGFKQLLSLGRSEIDERYRRFVELTTFHTA